MDIKPGTAIALFDSNGYYTLHAAIYLGQNERGIVVIDQWNMRDKKGNIIGRYAPKIRTLPFDNSGVLKINVGDSYHVIE